MDPSLDENLYRYLGENMAPVTFNIRKLYLKGFMTWLVDQGVMDLSCGSFWPKPRR